MHFERHIVDSFEFLEHELALGESDSLFFQAIQLFARHIENHRHVVDVDHYRARVRGLVMRGAAGKRGGIYNLGHECRLYVEDELLFGFLENKQPDDKGDNRHA